MAGKNQGKERRSVITAVSNDKTLIAVDHNLKNAFNN